MKPERRQEKILARLRALQREWRVDEIAAALGVSVLTVRRDLIALEKQRAILRTHGGCIYAGRMALESAYHRRVAGNFDLKEAIGRTAAREVKPGDAILINDGSTCFHLASHLGGIKQVTVYTNSIAMIPELVRTPGVSLHILGGEYNRDLFCVGGNLLRKAIEDLKFDIVFLGTDAVDHDGQCLVHAGESASVAHAMMARGRRKILLADHTKVGSGGHVKYCSLSNFDTWITTRGISASDRRRFSRMTQIKEARP